MDQMTLLELIKDRFEVGEVDINTYSPLTLAFIGDCIFDLVIRTVVVGRANRSPNKLHKEKADIVKAPTQSEMAKALSDVFTPEEQDIYRRGRNAHSYSTAKNASVGDYRRATGLEAVMGYLYLTGDDARCIELIKTGLDRLGIEI